MLTAGEDQQPGDLWCKVDKDFDLADREKSMQKGRPFQASWLNSYSWLIYHKNKCTAFCDICTKFAQKSSSPFMFMEDAKGFSNWKKAEERFREHELSETHRSAKRLAANYTDQGTVAEQLDEQLKATQKLRREGLIAHLSTIKTLLRQGLALRGHTEDGNVIVFNRDKAAAGVEGLQLLLKENRFLSHESIKEQ